MITLGAPRMNYAAPALEDSLYLRSVKEVAELCLPYWKESGILPGHPKLELSEPSKGKSRMKAEY